MIAAATDSPMRTASESHPLVAWSRCQLDDVAAVLQRQCHTWAANWGMKLPDSNPVRCTSYRTTETEWTPFIQEPAAACWSFEPAGFMNEVCRQLWDISLPTSPLALSASRACRDDLLDLVANAGGWSRGRGNEGASRPATTVWSGMVMADLPFGLQLLFCARAFCVLAPKAAHRKSDHAHPAQLVPLIDALGGSSIELHVHLDGCELDIGTVRDLRMGDVLRLQHRLHSAASVQSEGGARLFDAHLVRAGGHKAVELQAVC